MHNFGEGRGGWMTEEL